MVGTGLIDTNSDAKALNTAVENYINAMKDKAGSPRQWTQRIM